MADQITVPPLLGIGDFDKRKIKTLDFQGEWRELIGVPEVSGSWIIWGLSGNGKTRFALQLAKYMASFEKVYYNTREEGVKLSFKMALEAVNMRAVGTKFGFQNESFDQMKLRLRKERSPRIVFVDSIQFLMITYQQYIDLLQEFPNHLFIFISHAQGSQPKGDLADGVRYNSDVKINVNQFVATPVENTRYGGNKPMVIWEEGYRKKNLKLT